MIMDIKVFIAGVLALLVVLGHFLAGIRWYLNPMLASNTELVPKATMQCVFHYVSVFLVLSAVILMLIGSGGMDLLMSQLLVKYIGTNFILFGLVQIVYSLVNKVPKPFVTMFQWTLFLPIGILCLM